MNKKTIVLSFAIVIVSGLITYAGLSLFGSRSVAKNTTDTPASATESKASQNGLSVKLEIIDEQPTYTYGETLRLQSAVHNSGSTSRSYEFTSTCTGPDTYFDGKKASLIKLCGMAMTDVQLEPGETITYDDEYTFKEPSTEDSNRVLLDDTDGLTAARPGTYSITTQWQNVTSNAVSIVIKK